MVWTLTPSTRTLNVEIVAGTTSQSVQFTINDILNPTYAKTTSEIAISAYSSTATLIEFSDSSFKITPTAGTLVASLTSGNDITGSKERLTVDLTLSNNIPQTGTILIDLPKWNPEDDFPESVLSAGAVGCTAVSGFVLTNKISCTFTQDVNTGTTPDQLKVTGEFNSTGTSLQFKISNFLNPPSLSSFTNIKITTSTSTTSQIIDQASSVSIPLTQVATLDSSRIAITIADTEINQQTDYTFKIRVSLPLPPGSSITLKFPSTVTPASTGLIVTGVENLETDITEVYSSSTRVLTLTNIIFDTMDYVDAGSFISFSVNLVTNPSNLQTSDSFEYASFDASGMGIEKSTTGVTVTATSGSITSTTVTPVVTTIREDTSYVFSFKTENNVPVGAILYIVFPSIITALDRTSTACLSSGTSIDTASARCTVTGSRYLTITNAFSSTGVTAGTTIVFTVSDITNYVTTVESDTFEIQTKTSGGYTIDSLQTDVKVKATEGTISIFQTTPFSYETGVQTSYSFLLRIVDETILINSYFDLIFPDDLSIADTAYSENSCETTIGLSGGLTCEFQGTNELRLFNGFTTGDFLSGNLIFSIDGITNPRSLEVSDSFEIRFYDSNGDSQYSKTSGVTVTMTQESDFESISLAIGSEINGAINDYTFSITLSNLLKNGDIIMLTVPSLVTVSSSPT